MVKEGRDLWRESVMSGLILGKHGLSDQHVEQAAQSTLQRDFARLAIFKSLACEYVWCLAQGLAWGLSHCRSIK